VGVRTPSRLPVRQFESTYFARQYHSERSRGLLGVSVVPAATDFKMVLAIITHAGTTARQSGRKFCSRAWPFSLAMLSDEIEHRGRMGRMRQALDHAVITLRVTSRVLAHSRSDRQRMIAG
jgi:hypothetical protein